MTTNDSIMYTLGKLARVIYKDDMIPTNVLTLLLDKPATGVGMLMKSLQARRATDPKHKDHDRRVGQLFDQLPVALPDGPVGVEAQGPFWLGYYQAPANPVSRDINGLRQAGEQLFGPQWQTPLANALNLSDARRIREWLSGERRIPSGVWNDLRRLASERGFAALAVADGLSKDQPAE